MFITRNWRRALRIIMALIIARAAGTIIEPDYIPANWQHIVQETAMWVATILGVINPFLDLGSSDAKGDPAKEA
jgi:hypothetical protein